MKQSTLLSAIPLVLVATPAFAQAPAAPAPAAPPAAAAPAPAAVAPAAPAATPAPASAAAPPPAVDATVTPALPAPAPLPEPAPMPEAPKPAVPDRVAVSKDGFFQPSVNLQMWAVAERLGNSRTSDNEWSSTFRVRRAEIKAKGEIIPKTLGYAVMFDPARLLDFKSTSADVKDSTGASIGSTSVLAPPSGGKSSILQDIQLTYMTDYADVSIGQFKVPLSLEGSGSATKLYFPERALISSKYGDRRDIGLKIEKKFEYFSYILGLYNGEGQNNLDSNDQKDVVLRLEAYPIKDVTLAVVGYTSLGDRDLPGTKDRIEGDLKVEKNNFLLQAEAIRGWDVTGTPASHQKVEGQGFYVLAGYTFFDKLQPVVRIGSVDPEVGKDEKGLIAVNGTNVDKNDEITAYELGVNYYLKKHDAKVQLAGSFFDPEQRGSNTTFDLILATQVAF